jgi:hypothetical protein
MKTPSVFKSTPILVGLICLLAASAFAMEVELSWDSGPGVSNFTANYGCSCGVDFTAPEGTWSLIGIKYHYNGVLNLHHGYNVYAMANDEIIFGPVFNPNGWGSVWMTQVVDPPVDLSYLGNTAFICAIQFVYDSGSDHLDLNGLGPGPHDWFSPSFGVWYASTNGHWCIRAIVEGGYTGVETATLG